MSHYLLHVATLSPYQSGVVTTEVSWISSAASVNVMIRVVVVVWKIYVMYEKYSYSADIPYFQPI